MPSCRACCDLNLIGCYSGGAESSRTAARGGGGLRARRYEKSVMLPAELPVFTLSVSKAWLQVCMDRDESIRGLPNQASVWRNRRQTSNNHYAVSDMCQAKAMDRLVCGDVGFGKTEVAMRAAFVCCRRRQVAVLVPTTLLAQQHFENFRDRFANLPIRVERFCLDSNQLKSKVNNARCRWR